MARTFGEQSFKKKEGDLTLEDELADILFVLVCIANQTGVDLTTAVQKNFKKKTQRDKRRHRKNLKLRK
jgi:NTP pyrophosphatase (non-canonical NTP hydrolase)